MRHRAMRPAECSTSYLVPGRVVCDHAMTWAESAMGHLEQALWHALRSPHQRAEMTPGAMSIN